MNDVETGTLTPLERGDGTTAVGVNVLVTQANGFELVDGKTVMSRDIGY